MTTVQADFTENVTSGNAPLTVKFTDKSSGRPNSWLWDFGDGTTSSRQNPVHTYMSAGTYTVTLTAGTVFDQGGVHSGISTVVRKENLITVTGTVQAVQSAVVPALQNQAPASTGLSAAQIEAFVSHRSSLSTQGRQVTDLPSPGENSIQTAGTTGVSPVAPAIPGSISGTGRDLLQNRLQTGQSGSTAALLIRQRISG